MMKCEKCGSEISQVKINVFGRDGSDFYINVNTEEVEEDAVLFETDRNWCGYELSEEEMMECISCPHCNKFPFKYKEVQVYDVVRVVCFKSEVTDNERSVETNI